jgi:choline dehydrogenase-like flavoprotein
VGSGDLNIADHFHQVDDRGTSVALLFLIRAWRLYDIGSAFWGLLAEDRGGAAINDRIAKAGRRSSIFRSYILPKIDQPNLTVLVHTQVSKLVFSGNTVSGVEVSYRSQIMADREVILSLARSTHQGC